MPIFYNFNESEENRNYHISFCVAIKLFRVLVKQRKKSTMLLRFVLFTCTHKKRERESHVHAHINVNVDDDCDDDEISLHSFCQEITQQIISNFRSFLLCIIVFTSTVTFRMLKILLLTRAYVACTHWEEKNSTNWVFKQIGCYVNGKVNKIHC